MRHSRKEGDGKCTTTFMGVVQTLKEIVMFDQKIYQNPNSKEYTHKALGIHAQ